MDTNSVVNTLSALAQETRLAIYKALIEAHAPCGDVCGEAAGGLPAGVLARELNVAPATLSFHLKELSHAGLVQARREGRNIIYTAQLEAMTSLLGYLTKNCCSRTPSHIEQEEITL